jgi:broad specificity phosphatase PhoE
LPTAEPRTQIWIALVRHGRPAFDDTIRLAPCELRQWIVDFNRSPIVIAPAPASLRTLASAATIVASTYERSLSSARALGAVPFTDPLFIEADLPYTSWRFPKLPVRLWLAIFRVAWLFGFSEHSESYSSTVARARSAAEKLSAMSREGPVLLVGHGIFNRLIARHLRAMGWRGPKTPASEWWGVTVYD